MFYGLDAHKAFIQVCELGEDGPHRKDYPIGATAESLEAFAQRLGPTDHVVLEATFHTWAIHSILARRAGSVTVANPYEVRAIAKARVNTGKIDAHILAQLLRAGFLPAVQMPSEETWARRQLVSHRRLLVKQRAAAKNSIRAVLNSRLIEHLGVVCLGQREMGEGELECLRLSENPQGDLHARRGPPLAPPRARHADVFHLGSRRRGAAEYWRPGMTGRLQGFLSNVLAVAYKEAVVMRHDKPFLAMVLAQPITMLLIFGFALTNEPRNVPWVVLDQSQTALLARQARGAIT